MSLEPLSPDASGLVRTFLRLILLVVFVLIAFWIIGLMPLPSILTIILQVAIGLIALVGLAQTLGVRI